jgi:TATA-box binding protein (TBP) (component of TFIID and TFIIIB)
MTDFIDYINIKKLDVSNLPLGVSISTMCASGKLGTKLFNDNIAKYLELNSNDIITVKESDEKIRTLRTRIKKKAKKKKATVTKTKNKEKSFYNQVTVEIRATEGDYTSLEDEDIINVKLFKNGSIQMSGCKKMESINSVLNKLVSKLKVVKAKIEDNAIVEKQFVEEPEKLGVHNFKIDMINSNYAVKMTINRERLYDILLDKKIRCRYEPCIHACVTVKYVPPEDNEDEKVISIFVFEKGSIIITGAKKKSHIISSFNYINNIIKENSVQIEKKDLDTIILNSEFKNLLDM